MCFYLIEGCFVFYLIDESFLLGKKEGGFFIKEYVTFFYFMKMKSSFWIGFKYMKICGWGWVGYMEIGFCMGSFVGFSVRVESRGVVERLGFYYRMWYNFFVCGI